MAQMSKITVGGPISVWMAFVGNELGMRDTSEGTGYPRIDAVIASAEQTKNWTRAATASETHLYLISSAMNLGIFEPFTQEQTALQTYLTQRRAGKRLCDYAWRLYAQSVT